MTTPLGTPSTSQNRDSSPLVRFALNALDQLLTNTLNRFDRHRDDEWTPQMWPDAMVVTYGGER